MRSKNYFYLIIGIVIFFFGIYFQGTINKMIDQDLIPVRIPSEYYRVNQWLAKQKENFRIIWLPPQFTARTLEWASDRQINKFIIPSSEKPTFAPATPYSNLYFLLIQSIAGQAPHLSKFFDILNTKYIILRQDFEKETSESMQQSLTQDTFLKKIIEEKYLSVFENKQYSPFLWAPQEYSLVIGGREAIDILNSQENFNPVENALIFAEQSPNFYHQINNLHFKNIIFNNTTSDDLTFALIPETYLIKPISFTNEGAGEWQKASTEEPLHGEWHRIIDNLKISDWGFDFGKGLIYPEQENQKIQIPISIKENSPSVLIIRYFQNNKGGKLRVTIDQQENIIDTLNRNNKFTTKAFHFTPSLNQKTSTLTLCNVTGFNAVNLIALLPESQYMQYQNEAQDIIAHNKVIYLQNINPVMNLDPAQLNLPRPGNYDISLRFKKQPKDIEENQEDPVIPPNTIEGRNIIDFKQLQQEKNKNIIFTIGEEKYSLPPLSTLTDPWYDLGVSDLQHKNGIQFYQEPREKNLLTLNNFHILDVGNLSLEDQNISSNNLLSILNKDQNTVQIEISDSPNVPDREGRLITDAIRVNENEGFYLEYEFSGENMNGVSARVLFYGEDYDPIHQRTAFKVEDFMIDQSGNTDQKKISYFFGTPHKTYYIKIEFKATANLKQKSWFKIANFKLVKEKQINDINAILLVENQNQPEQTKRIPTIQYTKINPTQYQISLQNQSEPFLLAFAESYDPMWKIKEKNGKSYFRNKINSLLGKEKSISGFPLYSIINGFYIDPQKLKTNELIIEYEPQNWFEVGIWISASSMVISIFIFIVYEVHKKYRNKKRYA